MIPELSAIVKSIYEAEAADSALSREFLYSQSLCNIHLELTRDYHRLLELTVDYWGLLELTVDYWGLLEITGDY